MAATVGFITESPTLRAYDQETRRLHEADQREQARRVDEATRRGLLDYVGRARTQNDMPAAPDTPPASPLSGVTAGPIPPGEVVRGPSGAPDAPSGVKMNYVLGVLQDEARERGRTINVTPRGGHRDHATNNQAGGARNSLHLVDAARDIDLSQIPESERPALLRRAYELGARGFGAYPNMPNVLHLDSRNQGTAWGQGGTAANLPQTAPWFRDTVPGLIAQNHNLYQPATVGGQAILQPREGPSVASGGLTDPAARQVASVEGGAAGSAARNPNSSAAGPLQITDAMWRTYAPRLGLSEAQRNDPAVQQRIFLAFRADENQRHRGTLGRDLTDEEAYTSWGAGPGAFAAFLRAGPNADAYATYASAAPDTVEAAFRDNPRLLIRGQTVGQVMQNYGNYYRSGNGGSTTTPPASMPTSGAGALPSPSMTYPQQQPQQTRLPTYRNPLLDVVAALASTPGGGQRALEVLRAGETMATARGGQEIRAQGRPGAGANQQLQYERLAFQALGRGQMDMYQYFAQRAGLNLPPQVMQNAQLRERMSVGGQLARRHFPDPAQAQVFLREYLASGDPARALAAAGEPRGRPVNWRSEWLLNDHGQMQLFLRNPQDPSAPLQPAQVGQPPAPAPAAPAAPQGGQPPMGGMTTQPDLSGAPSTLSGVTTQPAAPQPSGPAPASSTATGAAVRPAPGAGRGGSESATAFRFRVLTEHMGLPPAEAAGIINGMRPTSAQISRAYTSVQGAVGNDITIPQRDKARVIEERMAVFGPNWRSMLQPGTPGAGGGAAPNSGNGATPPPGSPPNPFNGPAPPAAAPAPAGPAAAPPRPASVPAGSQYSPSRQQWRDPTGKIYDRDGNPVAPRA